jgi:prevent-host-death family protein
VSASEARSHLGELMRQAVENRETILVERGGEPYVVILAVARYERLLKDQPRDDWQVLVKVTAFVGQKAQSSVGHQVACNRMVSWARDSAA